MDQQKNLAPSAQLMDLVSRYQAPTPLGFGTSIAPLMATASYDNGQWSLGNIEPYASIPMEPAAKVFHYGQQIFEGMKAYRRNNGNPTLFRPRENAKRFQQSAIRMAMPPVPEQLFFDSLDRLVSYLAPIIPQGENESLYLRPLQIACEPGLSLKSSDRYLFFIIASPSGGYFSSSRVSALIEREKCRAAPGGTGAAKAGGNYGASLQSGIEANKLGFQQNLWLDAANRRYIEEFSGMNFFAVIDGDLVTPELTDSILPGITRDSIMKIAASRNISVREEKMDIDDLLKKISNGQCSEIFACGTAAVITPVAEIGEKNGTRYQLPHAAGPLAQALGADIAAIQTGSQKTFPDWIYEVEVTE